MITSRPTDPRPLPPPRRAARPHADRGSVDVSIQMLFGAMTVIMVILLVFEAVAYWHARNVYDEAAAEAVRVAAAYDGTCEAAVAVATDMVHRHAGEWSSTVSVECRQGDTVVVSVSGNSPGVLSGSFGFRVSASETAPKER